MSYIYLSLGSNLGNRQENIKKALEAIAHTIGNIKKISGFYETEPWGKKNQPWFLNCCSEIETILSHQELLEKCQNIEKIMGRTKKGKWGPRVIDIDILFYGDKSSKTAKLTIPHPRIRNRRFVLKPLHEIAPNFIHFLFKKTIKELLKECSDRSIVRLFHEYPTIKSPHNSIPH